MTETLHQAFDDKADAWEAYTQTAPGRLREELNWRYLSAHLRAEPLHILDAGGGTGGIALRLAEQGHTVHLLDLSSGMLAIAQQKAQVAKLISRITLVHADILTWEPALKFDVVLCHTLLEYVNPAPSLIARLAEWLVPAGLLSVAFVNRYAEPLIQALGKGNMSKALATLESETASADLFGVPRQLFTSQQMHKWIEATQLNIVGEYGVRVIADYLTSPKWKEDDELYQTLLTLEVALADQFPYRFMGRYGHIVAQNT